MLSWMRWRSINTPHQVQGSVTQIQQKMSAPNALDVAPDALHREFGVTLTASCTCKPSSHQMLQRSSGVSLRSRLVRNKFCNPLWVRDRTHPVWSGACVWCLNLGTRCVGSTPAYTGRTNSNTTTSGAPKSSALRRITNFPKRSLILSI